jgi:hypothetical protein
MFAFEQRSCILFGLGVMLNTLPVEWEMEKLRIFGVLQRFGILYFVCASVCTLCWPSLPKMVKQQLSSHERNKLKTTSVLVKKALDNTVHFKTVLKLEAQYNYSISEK